MDDIGGNFPLDTMIGFLVLLCLPFCHLKDPHFLQGSHYALVRISKAYVLKALVPRVHFGEVVIP